MNLDFFKSLLDNFDPANFLPKLESLVGRLDVIMRLTVLIAPLVLLVLGLLYFFLPAKEANYAFGYRFFWGMSSVEAWRLMQWIAGMVFGVLGVVLTIVMLIIGGGFKGKETMDMIWTAGKCVLWELGLVAAGCVGIDGTMLILFDRKGNRRPFTVPEKKPNEPTSKTAAHGAVKK